ncbi:MAG TPA: 50S ribosomal protein L21 [Candidatus Saccharimonadales bacterium]|nr:50S ribosomal protein L21 [Candidatus Saccharimonadales bacterium]
MEYAVVRSGGKQYRVAPGDIIKIEKVAGAANDPFVFSEVLLHVTDGKTHIGKPTISGLSVSGVILAQERGEKIRVSHFKAKARYRRVTGHRQHLTSIKISAIGAGSAKAATKPIAKAKPAAAARKTTKKS